MPAKLRLELTAQEVLDLEELRDHALKPYLRERAAAMLKIAKGNSGREELCRACSNRIGKTRSTNG